MMRGIDVSNWQGGIVPSQLNSIDFCIAKATEGMWFVDQFCDGIIQDCIAHNILFGYYHFASHTDAESEAKYFWNNTLGYSGHGIPVLDYECWQGTDVYWCECFIEEYYKLSGVWPILYISASHCADFKSSWIPEKCGLWLAGYPQAFENWADVEMPYDISPWEFCAIWQFTSSLKLDNWELDGNYAFMDRKGWNAYAGFRNAPEDKEPYNSGNSENTPKGKTCEELADEVMAGKWGNGWNREQAITAAYGASTYNHVQAIVNKRMGLEGC